MDTRVHMLRIGSRYGRGRKTREEQEDQEGIEDRREQRTQGIEEEEKKEHKRWRQLRGHKYKRCYTLLLFDWSSLRTSLRTCDDT